jgi:outer membrane protein OmpA-like peptidoglycan-associated protein
VGLVIIGAFALAVFLTPAAPPQTVVVLPGPDGRVGTVVVQRDGEETVLDTAYSMSRIGSDGAEHRAAMRDSEVKREFGTALAALPPRPVSFALYFISGRDQLTAESKVELRKALAELKRRAVPDIVVIGHTDTVGNTDANDQLSLARAGRVRDELVAQGLPADRIVAAGRGERELLVRTADGVAEPRNRRVEVNVR